VLGYRLDATRGDGGVLLPKDDHFIKRTSSIHHKRPSEAVEKLIFNKKPAKIEANTFIKQISNMRNKQRFPAPDESLVKQPTKTYHVHPVTNQRIDHD